MSATKGNDTYIDSYIDQYVYQYVLSESIIFMSVTITQDMALC